MMTRKLKRAGVVCAFFMSVIYLFACQPAEVENSHALADHEDPPSENAPLLSLDELLNASDVKQALADAALTQDRNTLKEYQEILLAAAKEVNLSPHERKLLEGEQGIIFLEYQGMLSNFKKEFEGVFFNFEDAEPIFKKYPAFTDAQSNMRQLIKKRDQLIFKVAQEVAQGEPRDEDLAAAREQWQRMMQAQSAID